MTYTSPTIPKTDNYGHGNGVSVTKHQFADALSAVEALTANREFDSFLVSQGARVKSITFKLGDTEVTAMYFTGLKKLKEKFEDNEVITNVLSAYEPRVFVAHDKHPAQPQAYSDFAYAMRNDWHDFNINGLSTQLDQDAQELYLDKLKAKVNASKAGAEDITDSYIRSFDTLILEAFTRVTGGMQGEAAFKRFMHFMRAPAMVFPDRTTSLVGKLYGHEYPYARHDFVLLHRKVEDAKDRWLASQGLPSASLYSTVKTLEDTMYGEYVKERTAEKEEEKLAAKLSAKEIKKYNFNFTRAAFAGAAALSFVSLSLLQVLNGIANHATNAAASSTPARISEIQPMLNGSKVACVYFDGQEYVLMVKDLNTGKERILPTPIPQVNDIPLITGKTKIVAVHPNSNIFLINTDGSDETTIPEKCHYFAMSPNESKIAYFNSDSSLKIYDMATKTTKTICTTLYPYGDSKYPGNIEWSPDGKSLILLASDRSSVEPGTANIFKLPIGSSPVKIKDLQGKSIDCFDVSGNGEYMLAYGRKDGSILYMDKSGSVLQSVHPEDSADEHTLIFLNPVLSYDGKKILACARTNTNISETKIETKENLHFWDSKTNKWTYLDDSTYHAWKDNSNVLLVPNKDLTRIKQINVNNYASPIDDRPSEQPSDKTFSPNDISTTVYQHYTERSKDSVDATLKVMQNTMDIILGNMPDGQASYIDNDVHLVVNKQSGVNIDRIEGKYQTSWVDEEGAAQTTTVTIPFAKSSSSSSSEQWAKRVQFGVPAPMKQILYDLVIDQDLEETIKEIQDLDNAKIYPKWVLTDLLINGQNVDIPDKPLMSMPANLAPGSPVLVDTTASPVDTSIKDSSGRVTGAIYDREKFVREARDIPFSVYSGRSSDTIVVFGADVGNQYQKNIVGLGDGIYKSKTTVVEGDKVVSSSESSGAVKSGSFTQINFTVGEQANIIPVSNNPVRDKAPSPNSEQSNWIALAGGIAGTLTALGVGAGIYHNRRTTAHLKGKKIHVKQPLLDEDHRTIGDSRAALDKQTSTD